ncbi:MAG: hypothetical protein XD85_0498 [Parcubacteria bacterium 34_609]|nr:MAG: hypothetical protein XD85_0498 [Parcubacteria bacterium 34_609]
MNKIIKNLILTDIAFWTGWGMVTPVFAIFITDRIVGGTALTVGIAVAIYWLCRSLLVFPFAKIIDKYQYVVAFSIAGTLAMISVIVLLCLRKEIEGVFNRNFPFNIIDIFRRE